MTRDESNKNYMEEQIEEIEDEFNEDLGIGENSSDDNSSNNGDDEEGFSKDDEVILSPAKIILIKFRNNKLAMVGFWIFAIIVATVIVTHFYTKIIGYDFAYTDTALKNLPPSLDYPFGTDKYGRNTFVRVLEGGWISLQVGFLSTFMAVTIGLIMGAISGYFGGVVDIVIMRIVEVIYSFPFLAIAYIISAIFIDKPAEYRLYVTVFTMGLIMWTGLARLVRGQIMGLREQEFILATKALGIKKRHQITRHLIPNVLATVVVSATLTFASSILSEAFLSFLGLSVTEPIPTWGALLSKAAKNSTSLRKYWWIWVFPGIMLFMFIMSINLVGEGLRDAIDPKSEYTTKAQKRAMKAMKKMARLEAKKEKETVKGGA